MPDPKRLDRTYLFHWLRQPRVIDVLMEKNTGARMPRADMALLLRMQIPLPNMDKQREIACVLNRATEIARRAEAARAHVRAVIPALFLDSFGDPATNPKGWSVKGLGDLITSGPQNGLYRPASDYGDGVRILRIDSFDAGEIVKEAELKRLRLDDATIEKFCLEEGDVVVNRVNSPPQLGKAAIIPKLSEPVVFESNMMRLRVNPSVLMPQVLGVMLQLDSVRRALIKNAKHAINQSSINQGDVKALELLVPPLPLQSIFAEQVLRLQGISRQLDAAADKAEAMAASLSAEVFGG